MGTHAPRSHAVTAQLTSHQKKISNLSTMTLNETLENTPAHNMLFVAGDFNARIGPEEELYNFSLEINRNGQQLCDFMDQLNLIAINTRFQKHHSKLWTFYPSGNKAQLDFILGRKKWSNSFKDCAAYNTFESICSDHRIISCKCMISFRQSKAYREDPMKLIDWKSVAHDAEMTEKYAVAVHNRYEVLINQTSKASCDHKYENLITANKEMALNILPKKRKRKNNKACSKDVTKF